MTTFTTGEGLRTLLNRLHTAGPDAWRSDPEAEELMTYAIRKYRPLANRHHCEPEDAAVAAFEALRASAVRHAEDPWAVLTRAVQVSLTAEERAGGLLCSPAQARRAHIARNHDARRFSDTEADLLEFHPAFQVDPTNILGEPSEPTPDEATTEQAPTGGYEAVDAAVALFVALGWPRNTITCALGYITSGLTRTGSRMRAHAMLRRDQAARAFLDLDRCAWATLLRLILGNPNPDLRFTAAGRGVLLQLLIGHTLAELLADDLLVREISQSAPRLARAEQEA